MAALPAVLLGLCLAEPAASPPSQVRCCVGLALVVELGLLAGLTVADMGVLAALASGNRCLTGARCSCGSSNLRTGTLPALVEEEGGVLLAPLLLGAAGLAPVEDGVVLLMSSCSVL
jgi:hypothetical protein